MNRVFFFFQHTSLYACVITTLTVKGTWDLRQRPEINFGQLIDFERRFIVKCNRPGGVTSSHLRINHILRQGKTDSITFFFFFFQLHFLFSVLQQLKMREFLSPGWCWQLAYIFWTDSLYLAAILHWRMWLRAQMLRREKRQRGTMGYRVSLCAVAESSLWSVLEVYEGHSCEEYQ